MPTSPFLALSRVSPVPRRRRFAALALGIALCALVLVPSAPAAPVLRPTGSFAGSAPLALTARVTQPQGLSPSQIRSTYGLPTTGARGQTVAIVSAYDDPYLETDLAAYDKRFSLPACTFANHCLRKLNQQGHTTPLPQTDLTGGTWISETALGSELVHALCQSCSIVVAEANDDLVSDFSSTVATAAKAGATEIVTTFTPPETSDENSLAGDYLSARSIVVAATGDPPDGQYGYVGGLNFPSSLPSVLAVGGTQLTLGAGGHFAESAWSGSVSGCSFYEAAPSWQARIKSASDCGNFRAAADVSAVAAPGAIVHVTGAGQPGGPWYVAKGTSLSAPVIGAVIGLAGSVGDTEPQMLYARQLSDPGAFHDIVTGANTTICKVPICGGFRGWDGPTGLGSPAGLEAFLPGGPVVSAGHPHLAVVAAHSRAGVSRHWGVSLALHNANPFRVSGTMTLSRTMNVGGHSQTVTFARTSFHRSSLDDGVANLTIAAAARSALRGAHHVVVNVSIAGKGASGRTVTVRQRLTLVGPR